MEEEIFHKFRDFMTGVTKIDELGNAGSRLISGFEQALEFIWRPPIDTKSTVISKIIVAHETNRVESYVNSGCMKPSDSVQSVTNLHSCKCGLLNRISKAKVLLNELDGILGDLTRAIEGTHGNLLVFADVDSQIDLNEQATYNKDSEESVSLSQFTEKRKNTDALHLASLMTIIWGMFKQDYLMQEKIVSALDLKVSSEELQSFCEMWSWRPFINDDIMNQAWELIP